MNIKIHVGPITYAHQFPLSYDKLGPTNVILQAAWLLYGGKSTLEKLADGKRVVWSRCHIIKCRIYQVEIYVHLYVFMK